MAAIVTPRGSSLNAFRGHVSSGAGAAVRERRPTGPAFECAVEGARLGEPEKEPDLADREPSFAQVTLGQFPPHVRHDPPEGRALLVVKTLGRSGFAALPGSSSRPA